VVIQTHLTATVRSNHNESLNYPHVTLGRNQSETTDSFGQKRKLLLQLVLADGEQVRQVNATSMFASYLTNKLTTGWEIIISTLA